MAHEHIHMLSRNVSCMKRAGADAPSLLLALLSSEKRARGQQVVRCARDTSFVVYVLCSHDHACAHMFSLNRLPTTHFSLYKLLIIGDDVNWNKRARV